ncbi:Protein spinster-like 1 [Holothuria leucospilota]|uniref:Protein spinster-like 1 n=1 Tax=Holothuria leucospilota TaxID=206669 RepID=A0A9Q1CEB6_HOLLE|nr:Protein spinster-like 1 [Holothuria leucospilota]
MMMAETDYEQKHLLQGEREEEDERRRNDGQMPNDSEVVGAQAYVSVAILCFVNLLNYVDRYTIAANLGDIQRSFRISNNNSAAGLIQTVFIVGYMLTSPLFGYLGDRYSRKLIIASGITVWSALTLAGSFVSDDRFWLFVLVRAFVGVGEASYVTIAGTIIGDLFVGNRRSQMLMVFYFAIPVGSGLGYIAGSAVATWFHDWRFALRFTPIFGIVCVFLIICVLKEPQRGQAETSNQPMSNTDYLADLKALTKNKSYISSSLGLTAQCWVIGALSLWAVKTIEYAYTLQGFDNGNVSYIFGALTCFAGFAGVGLGTSSAQYVRQYNPRADPLVCAFGMLCGTPFLFLGIYVADSQVTVAWIFILIAETLLFLNWALIPDILLYVLIPTRRATGNAIQMLMSHLLGDALSPWIIGFISDRIRNGMSAPSSIHDQYYSLVYSLYIGCFVTALGGGFFLMTALFVVEDKQRVEKIVASTRAMNGGALEGNSVDEDR